MINKLTNEDAVRQNEHTGRDLNFLCLPAILTYKNLKLPHNKDVGDMITSVISLKIVFIQEHLTLQSYIYI